MAVRSRLRAAPRPLAWLASGLLALPGWLPAAMARTPSAPAAPASDESFATVLHQGDLEALQRACLEASQFGLDGRLRLLRRRLLTVHPAPAPLPVVLANAEVLLQCRAPEAALEVLKRYGPAPGAERQAWLLLQWRAAAAALDHRRASQALVGLAELEGQDLERLSIPLAAGGGRVVERPAVDLLIDHWQALSLGDDVVRAARRSRQPGLASAERLREVLPMLGTLPAQERQQLLEWALEQAAGAGAWGLVAELLDRQIDLQQAVGEPADLAVGRRLRLSPRLDDAYGEWQLRRRLAPRGPGEPQRTAGLERQLRSPRAPGGHAGPAAAPVTPVPPSQPPAHSSVQP